MANARSTRSPRLRIELTEQLIEESKERDSSHCMIADAVRAAYPAAVNVSVDIQTIRFSDRSKGHRYTYLTPRVAQVALIDFDQGNTPEPFDFVLRGAQVTAAGIRQKSTKNLTEEELAKMRANAAKGRAALVNRKPGTGTVPDKVGGKTPPTTPFARRRAFGLRALDR